MREERSTLGTQTNPTVNDVAREGARKIYYWRPAWARSCTVSYMRFEDYNGTQRLLLTGFCTINVTYYSSVRTGNTRLDDIKSLEPTDEDLLNSNAALAIKAWIVTLEYTGSVELLVRIRSTLKTSGQIDGNLGHREDAIKLLDRLIKERRGE